MRLFKTLLLSLMLTACTGIPEGVEPVTGFELDRYLGKWYEIARLDHSFEEGLTSVTAEYSLHEDGHVQVIIVGLMLQKTSGKKQREKPNLFNPVISASLKFRSSAHFMAVI